MTIWRMHKACCIPKVTNTHSEYVIHFCFTTATMVTWTRLVVTLDVHCSPRYLSDGSSSTTKQQKDLRAALSCSTISKGGRSVKLKTHSESSRFSVPSYMQHFYRQPNSSMKSHLFLYVSDILWSESKGLLVHHWWNSSFFINDFRNTFLPFHNLHSHVSWSSRGTSLSHTYVTLHGSPSEATSRTSVPFMERTVYCSAVHGPPQAPDT